jgi:hypothetical protein
MKRLSLAWAIEVLSLKNTPKIIEEQFDEQGVTYLIGCNARGCPNVAIKTRPHALYCSDRCKVRASRERARAEKILHNAAIGLMNSAARNLLMEEE